MEFVLVIHAQSPYGIRAAAMQLKIGGASGLADVGPEKHPFIICTDLDMSVPGVIQCTHLQDPGDPDRKPRRLVLPAASVLFALEVPSPQEADAKAQASGGFHLH